MGARVPIFSCSYTAVYQTSYSKRALTVVYRDLLRHFRSCSTHRGICHPENPAHAGQQPPIRPTTHSHRVVHTIIPHHLLPRLASPKLAQSQALLYDLSTRHSSSHHRHHRPLPKQYPAHTRLIRHSYCMGQYRFYCASRIVHTTTDTRILVDVAMHAWSCRLQMS